MVNNTYCPIFRVGDVVRYAQQDFTKLARKVESKVHCKGNTIVFCSLSAEHYTVYRN